MSTITRPTTTQTCSTPSTNPSSGEKLLNMVSSISEKKLCALTSIYVLFTSIFSKVVEIVAITWSEPCSNNPRQIINLIKLSEWIFDIWLWKENQQWSKIQSSVTHMHSRTPPPKKKPFRPWHILHCSSNRLW